MLRYSFIIPTWQEEKSIKGTLECIKTQTLRPYETILIDNMSSDETVALSKGYDIKVIRRKANIPKAKNIGADIAEGDIIVFLDADTRIEPTFVENIDKVLNEHHNISLVYCGHFIRPGARYLDRFLVTLIFNIIPRVSLSVRFPLLIGDCLIIPKDKFIEVGRFDESFHIAEDLNIAKRLMKIGKIHIEKKPLIETNMRRFSSDLPRTIMDWTKNLIYYIMFGRARPCIYPPIR